MNHIPGDLKYSSTHTWAEMLDNDLLRVGITDYAGGQFYSLAEVKRRRFCVEK